MAGRWGWSGLFMRFRREGDEAPMPGVLLHLAARRGNKQYVRWHRYAAYASPLSPRAEHPSVKMHARGGRIVGRSRQLMKSPLGNGGCPGVGGAGLETIGKEGEFVADPGSARSAGIAARISREIDGGHSRGRQLRVVRQPAAVGG